MAGTSQRLAPYRARLLDLQAQLVHILGTKTVHALFDRAVIEIRQTYPEMALLRANDRGLNLEAVEDALEPKSDEYIRSAFEALTGVVLLILARLLGKEVAGRLLAGEDNGGPSGGFR
jgi:hypothetical protein